VVIADLLPQTRGAGNRQGRAGLATATPQRIRAGREMMEVARVRITDEGRRVLDESIWIGRINPM
jgi:hypothetical protein